MHERHRRANLSTRQAAQPDQPVFPEGFPSCGRHLCYHGEQGLQLGRLLRERAERIGRRKHFVCVANYTLPSKIANAIHNFRGTGPSVRQIAAVEDQIGRSLPQVRQNGLKRGSVAVDVGYHCNPHRVSPVPGTGAKV